MLKPDEYLEYAAHVQSYFIPLLQEIKEEQIEIALYCSPSEYLYKNYIDIMRISDTQYSFIFSECGKRGPFGAMLLPLIADRFDSFCRSGQSTDEALIEYLYTLSNAIWVWELPQMVIPAQVGFIDINTGKIRLTHAGSNIVNMYKGHSESIQSFEMAQSPVAGVFPSKMLKDSNAFSVSTFDFNKEDIFFLASYSLETSTRNFRNTEGSCIAKADNGDDYDPGIETDEDFGPERMKDVLGAILGKKDYQLTKNNGEQPREELHFEFSKCGGSLEDAVHGLAAVEKVFRQTPVPGNTDTVEVDKPVLDILQNSFREYDRYFSNPVEEQEGEGIMLFAGLEEDRPRGDITIAAVRLG